MEKFNRLARQRATVEAVRIEPRIITRNLMCRRQEVSTSEEYVDTEVSSMETTFLSTSELFLKEFHLLDFNADVRVTIYEDPTDKYSGVVLSFEEVEVSLQRGRRGVVSIELSQPVLVKPNIRYKIEIRVEHRYKYIGDRFAKTVKLEDGTIIDFGDEMPYVQRLDFVKQEIEQ